MECSSRIFFWLLCSQATKSRGKCSLEIWIYLNIKLLLFCSFIFICPYPGIWFSIFYFLFLFYSSNICFCSSTYSTSKPLFLPSLFFLFYLPHRLAPFHISFFHSFITYSLLPSFLFLLHPFHFLASLIPDSIFFFPLTPHFPLFCFTTTPLSLLMIRSCPSFLYYNPPTNTVLKNCLP